MEPIYFLPNTDLAVGSLIGKAKAVLSDESYTVEPNDINSVVSVFNILRYFDNGHEGNLGKPDRGIIERFILTFIKNNHPATVLSLFNDLNIRLKDDFWDFFAVYRLYAKVDDAQFTAFLEKHKPNIRPLLCLPPIQNKYKEPLKEYFLSDVENVNFILDKNETGYRSLGEERPKVPSLVTKKDEQNLISNYIDSPGAAPGRLMVISKMKDLPARRKLAAQQKEKEISDKVFSQASSMQFGIRLSYTEQTEPVKITYDSGITEYEYDISWIRNNVDEATLLNNFIHLFQFVDSRSGINLCYQKSESGIMEEIIGVNRVDWHPESMDFSLKNHAAMLQLHSYNNILGELDTSIEHLINWFFRDYLRNEFRIENYQADLHEGGSNYYEKCRIIAPEIERILKQFECLIDEGEINHELIAIDSNPFPSSKCRSLIDKKYCYLNSKDLEVATYYFFSDQCMLLYNSNTDTSYDSFLKRLIEEQPGKHDFEEYQNGDLEWLIANGYLKYDDNDKVRILKEATVVFLGEIHKTGCLCYNSCRDVNRAALDTMLNSGELISESFMFSRPERNFIDYHLNKQQFINSLDLRNKYAHGSHLGAAEGDHEHFCNYFQLLKIMVSIVLKINDEFCTVYPEENG